MIAVVCGTGDTLWSDLASVDWIVFDEMVAVNAAAALLWDRPIDALATCHPENLKRWEGQRGGLRRLFDPGGGRLRPDRYRKYASRNPSLVDEMLQADGRGSSGMFGVRVALHRGADKVVCCGIPITETRHAAGSDKWGDADWAEAKIHMEGWEKAVASFAGRVKSQSGLTRDLLGPATPGWLLS